MEMLQLEVEHVVAPAPTFFPPSSPQNRGLPWPKEMGTPKGNGILKFGSVDHADSGALS